MTHARHGWRFIRITQQNVPGARRAGVIEIVELKQGKVLIGEVFSSDPDLVQAS